MALHVGSKTEEAEKQENKRREAIQEELQHKLELEEKAHKVVERLLDNGIEDDFLISCAKFILPDHYKDVVEERAIVKQCGYPLCDNTLGPMPKKKYHISMKTNKVYDITDRKCFCSNECYKASKYYASQISTVPLWMRDKDEPNPIQLLSNLPKPSQPVSGEEVFLKERVDPENIEIEANIEEAKAKKTAVSELTDDLMSIKFFRDEDEHMEQFLVQMEDEELSSADEITMNSVDKNSKSATAENVQPSSKKEQIEIKPRKSNEPGKIINILKLVTDCLKEWKTERTLQYLNNIAVEHDADVKINTTVNVKHNLEMKNAKTDDLIKVKGNDDEMKNTTEVQKTSQSKYVGSLSEQRMRAMEEEAYRIRIEEMFYGKKSVTKKPKKGIEENIPDDKPIAMPYVDSQSQMAIRRKILLDRLNKAFSEFIGSLSLSIHEFSSDLSALVHTFHLGNRNMTFKPVGWTLLAIILLHMLARKNEVILSAIKLQHNLLSAMLKKINVEYKELQVSIDSFLKTE